MPSDRALPLNRIVEAAEKLPPFPDIIWKVMPLIQRMAPVGEIEAVVRYDPVITAKILALSQSARYKRLNVVGSLRDAIVYLGQQQLIEVIMTACASHYFPKESVEGYDLREGELWEHAVATGLMAEIVARALGRTDHFLIYTAALLHDIGKTVLHHHVADYFDSIFALVKDRRMRFLDAEREVLGIDHQQLGMAIARRWNFPAEVVHAIGYHHSPAKAPAHRELVSLIYVANRSVSALGVGCGVDGFLQPNEDQVFSEIGVTTAMVDRFLADLMESLSETKQFLVA